MVREKNSEVTAKRMVSLERDQGGGNTKERFSVNERYSSVHGESQGENKVRRFNTGMKGFMGENSFSQARKP